MPQLDLGKVVGDTGPQGPKGDQGIQGPAGQTGPGVAVGGSANQVLVKHSGTNYDTQWVDAGNLPSIAGVQDAIAIVANGDTHPAIASGQFVYVRNHSTLAEGLYKATAAIGTDVALTTSNLTADGSGGLNDLKGQIDSLNSKFTDIQMTTDNLNFSQNVTYRAGGYYKIGKMVFVQFRLVAARDITGTGSTTLFTGLPKPQHYVDTSLSDETSAIGIWTMYSNSKMQSDIKIYINNIGDATLSGDRTTIPADTIIGFSGVYLARE